MITLEQSLALIDSAISRYEVCKISFTHDQSEMIRDLSVGLFYLSEHRIRAHEQWMYHYFMSKGKSHVAKEMEANMRVPELYKIRHIMQSANKVLDSMRATIYGNKNV